MEPLHGDKKDKSKMTSNDFLDNFDMQINAFIVNKIMEFAKRDRCEHFEFEYSSAAQEFEDKKIQDVLDALKSSDSALDFKVNQEIFGNDPDSRFSNVIEFWLMYVAFNVRESFGHFLDTYECDSSIDLHTEQLMLMIADSARKMKFTGFFEIKKLLDERIHRLLTSSTSCVADDKFDNLETLIDQILDQNDMLTDIINDGNDND